MIKEKFIMALDQGTTSSRAIIFDHIGNIRAIARKEFRQHYPEAGWVEHDPYDIYSSQIEAMSESLQKSGINVDDICSAGITNQRETTILWERNSGKPVYPAIVWQDRRTSDHCDILKKQGMDGMIRQKTGLVIDPYFSATKISWILERIPGLRKRAESGEICFGTVDSWLIWNLTKGKVHITDVSNASRTMLFNIHTLQWDPELLKLFDIPGILLPEVKSSSEYYTAISDQIPGSGIPLTGIAGDQQAALFGQLCLEEGMTKNTYGTGCFLVMNTGHKPVISKNNLLSTVAWQINGQTSYALEGSIFTTGAAVQWLRDGLGIIGSADDTEKLATSIPDNGGVYFVPALTGLGAPHWDPYARGSVFGITRGTTRAHFCRATLESIAYQVNDIMMSMAEDAGQLIKELRVDGGAVKNNFLMQFQSDILGSNVIRPVIMETTALGVAYLSGLASGFWDSINDLQKQWKAEKIFTPVMQRTEAEQLITVWKRALLRTRNWVQ